MKERDKLYKLKINNPFNDEISQHFNRSKSIVEKKRKQRKKEFFKNQWNNAGSDQRKQWRCINSLIKGNNNYQQEIGTIEHLDTLISDPKQISQAFNEYFINTGRKI